MPPRPRIHNRPMLISASPRFTFVPKMSTVGPNGITAMPVTANINPSHGAAQ